MQRILAFFCAFLPAAAARSVSARGALRRNPVVGGVQHLHADSTNGSRNVNFNHNISLDKLNEHEPVKHIVVEGSVHEHDWWGTPNSGLDHHPLQRGLDHGIVGRECTAQTVFQQCGTGYICSHGVCGECALSRDCGEKYLCQRSEHGHMMCVPRDLQSQWGWREIVGTILIVFTALMSAAAGMGGGGVYVPLLLLLMGLSTKEAVPLSQCMILGGACVNILMFCGERHPKFPQRSRIDYDVIMMLNPGLAAGVTIGVICHIISPQWIIICTLVVTLVIALQKSLTKGMQQWKKESDALAKAQASASSSSSQGGSGGGAVAQPQIKGVDFATFRELAVHNQRSMALIIGLWAALCVLNVFKAPQCSLLYWIQITGMMIICLGFTFVGAKIMSGQSSAENQQEGVLQWTATNLWLYPVLSLVAGFLGGFLGIGGGIIMGPMLIELGMTNEANQATTATFVFLSSSLATIQFIVLGKIMPHYVVWFTVWVILATFVGQTLIDWALKKWQRSSLIVLSIAGIIAGSLVMMSIVGCMDIIHDIQRGAYMGFSPHALCMGGHR
eukprot:gnl/TRDRNA2_/TRDRNA2_130756_c0_seq1.p1 gnl/TRDRNA2_/TRDRNA2_130756_c0~~gnl/TRDRNA2_/TRDRNA2_130756_c0_seq1.p1  ORF type:complete len:558 (-),score=123.77 gnl/TRDRNA2_/TRDRNA2_130756_c0_seq1:117-1790(-)